MGRYLPPGPPEAPAGTQPEIDGKLVCLICGAAYRQLGQHVVARHRISADDYRARFGLPASRGLHSTAVRQARAARGRRQWSEDPQLRQRLKPSRTTAAQRAAKAAATRQATLSRPGVQAAARANGRAVQGAWLATVDERLDTAAVAAGFPDLARVLAATADLPAHDVARLLKTISTRQIQLARRRHAGTTAIVGGPALCLECEMPYRGLGQHVRMAHGMNMNDYRHRYPLDAAALAAGL